MLRLPDVPVFEQPAGDGYDDGLEGDRILPDASKLITLGND